MTSLCFLIKTGEIKLGGSPENNTNYEINFGIGPKPNSPPAILSMGGKNRGL